MTKFEAVTIRAQMYRELAKEALVLHNHFLQMAELLEKGARLMTPEEGGKDIMNVDFPF